MVSVEIISVLNKLTRSLSLSLPENQLLQNYSWYPHDPFKYQQEESIYQQKKELFHQIYPHIKSLCQKLKFPDDHLVLTTFWSFWLPLAWELAHQQKEQSSALVFGVLGGQGTGKTTLTTILPVIWSCFDLASVAISIDDLYKTYAQRQELLKSDPRLIWRGPPATHDVELGIKTIEQLQQGETSVSIPRFDKSAYDGMGERTSPEIVNKVDIILLEGWFVGIEPIEIKALESLPFPIVSEDDRQFALDSNERLKEYVPLWEKIDYLMIFNPQEYQYSLQWRKEAEHKMIAQGKTGMSDAQIEQFVYYFWQALHPEIYIKPLSKNAEKTNLVVNINSNHGIDLIYRP